MKSTNLNNSNRALALKLTEGNMSISKYNQYTNKGMLGKLLNGFTNHKDSDESAFTSTNIY